LERTARSADDGQVRRPLLIGLASVAAALSLPAAALAAPAVRTGLVYRHARDESGRRVSLRLDLYRPDAGAARRAAIVWVHGGGFTEGDRTGMTQYAQEFAGRGYVTASIDYRLASAAGLRRRGYGVVIGDARRDAQAAVRWMRARAHTLGVDPGHIFIGGYSAGAVIATHVAEYPGALTRVAGAVVLAGGGDTGGFDRGDAPLLMLHGTADESVSYSWARDTCAAARHARSGCTFVSYRGVGHDLPFSRYRQVVGRVASWLAARV
jgi:predicted esterase